MRGISEKERAALAELIRDAMVDAVGREPVHALDNDAHPVHDARAARHPRRDRHPRAARGVAHDPDESRAPVLRQWKNREKICLVQGGVQFAVHHRAARVDVCDIEGVFVGAARKSDAERLAHDGMRAVTPGDVGRIRCFDRAIPTLHAGAHAAVDLLEPDHLGLSLDVDTGGVQAIDQHTFVFVLRKDEDVRVRADARSDVAERRMGHVARPVPRD